MKTRILLLLGAALALLTVTAAANAAADPRIPDTSVWQALPAPDGGDVQAIAASPAFAADQTLFAGTQAGLYRSLDAGQHWVALGPGADSAVKIMPSPAYPSDHTLFVLMETTGPPGRRVLRSTDAGATWQTIWESPAVQDLAVSPNFALDRTLFLAGAPFGQGQVYRSTDGGDSWLPTAGQPANLDAYLLAISPTYAVDRTLFVAGYGPMHRSTDGGASWQRLGAAGPNYSLAISPRFAVDRTLWAVYREIEASVTQPEAGAIRSTDGGATWRNVTAGLDGNYNQNYRSLAPEPAGEAVYLALAGPQWDPRFPPRVYRSDNRGQRWAPQELLPGGAAPSQVLAPGALPDLFALAGGTIYRHTGLCYEALADGGFETGPELLDYPSIARAWETPSTPLPAGYAEDIRYAGAFAMRTGAGPAGPNVYSYSSARQWVRIPADADGATLTFWRYPTLGDLAAVGMDAVDAAELLAAGPEVADFQYLLAVFADGSFDTLRTWRDNSQAWLLTEVDLSAYAGRSFYLHFGAFNNGAGGRSGMVLDGVSVRSCLQLPQSPRLYLPMMLRGLDASPAETPTVTATPTTVFAATPTHTATPTPTATALPTAIPTAAPGLVPTPYWSGQLNLPAGSRPHGVAASAAGDQVYVAFHGIDHGGRTLGVVNEYLSFKAQIDLGPAGQGPNGVAVLPGSGRVVVANRQTNNVIVVDPTAGAVVQQIPAGMMPDGVFVAGDHGYIANYGNDTVTVFDPATLAVIRTLYGVGHEPALFAGDPAGGDVFLSAHGSNQVVALRDGQVIGQWDGITAPYGITYDPASRRLYVANRGLAHTVTVIDVYLDQIVGMIAVGREPYVLLVNPDSGHLFVACDDEVKVYDTLDWSLITSIPAPPGATEGIAFEARLSKAFVASAASDALTAIQDQGPAQVVFASDRDGNGEIYRMLPDGRRQVRLTFTPDAWENAPAGSPDGRWIAFERMDGSGGPSQIWLMSRDGRGATMLTDGPFNNLHPTWSADSRRIALASDRDGDWDIYVLDLATRGLTKLTDNTRDDLHPAWSAMNGRIAFTSYRTPSNGEIFTMAADGSDVRQVTGGFDDSSPSWSPAGDRIAFWGSRPQGQALYTARSDGSDIRLVAPQALRPGGPAWGFAGEAIVFSGYRPGSGYSEILRIQADGSGLVLLTNNEVNFDYSPNWLAGW
jgi:YVTN family beta-propeller protein